MLIQVAIKFQVPPTCEIPVLITKLVSRLGVKLEDNGSGSDMTLRAWDRFIKALFSCDNCFLYSVIIDLLVFAYSAIEVGSDLCFVRHSHFQTISLNINLVLLNFYSYLFFFFFFLQWDCLATDA